MSYFQWTPQMSVGNTHLDEDHQGLISLINQLADKVDAEFSSETETPNGELLDIKAIFSALIQYAEIHFAREEKILEAVKYPHIQSHRGGHNGFIHDIEHMREKFADSHGHARKTLVDYLKDWLKFHILIEDMAYKPYIEDAPDIAASVDCFDVFDIWEARHDIPKDGTKSG